MDLRIYFKGKIEHWGVYTLTRNVITQNLFWRLVDIQYNEHDIKYYYPDALPYPPQKDLGSFPFNQEEWEDCVQP